MDEQIKNIECERCKIKPQKGIVIMNVEGVWLCGNCFIEWKEKRKKKVLEIFE